MDTDDHLEFPTPSEAYQKKPPVSDAEAVRRAKKGAKKKLTMSVVQRTLLNL
jgi:hypothetical protein